MYYYGYSVQLQLQIIFSSVELNEIIDRQERKWKRKTDKNAKKMPLPDLSQPKND